MFDCTTDNYETLYARWLEKPGALLDWAEYRPEQKLLDLCGGTGAVSKAALALGAERVWLLDLNPRVDDSRILVCRDRAERLRGGVYNPLDEDDSGWVPVGRWGADQRGEKPWDMVVCRQSLGYLDLPRVARALHSVLSPGGRFVFNTFVRPKFAAKVYRRDGRFFFEASGFLGRTVLHLQAMDGDFDITKFHWWTQDDVRDAFVRSGLFRVRNFKDSPTTFWFDLERVASQGEVRAEIRR